MRTDYLQDARLDADVELTRAELRSTVGALHAKLSPRNQIQNALEKRRTVALPLLGLSGAGVALSFLRHQHKKGRRV